MKYKDTAVGLLFALICFIPVFLAERFNLPYLTKSMVKIISFFIPVLFYYVTFRYRITDILRLRPLKNAAVLYICMAVAFAGIIILFFALKKYIDTDSIVKSLMKKERLTKENCIFVFAYIIIVNSFLEEAFFRGFLFGIFEKNGLVKTGYAVSGIVFAVYHIGIVSTWFNPWILAFCIAGLVLVGFALTFISRKYKTVAASWIVHACANLAINSIGAYLIFTF